MEETKGASVPTRCKFRCLSLTYTHKGEAIVKLAPVIAKSGDWPGGSEENSKFWKASPSGECELQFANNKECLFEPGAYYYVDIEQMHLEDEGFHPDRWKLYEVTDRASQLALYFDLCWSGARSIRSGTFKVAIENRDAWPPFQRAAGTSWRLTFLLAEDGNSGCPYTS